MNDPLGRYRNPGGVGGNVVAGPVQTPYEAFGLAKKRPLRLKIRPAMRAWERVGYAHLLRILENGIYGTQLSLVFTFGVVLIEGRNLQPIADAIDAETCDFIQEFDSDRWPTPTDEKTPFISKIAIHMPAAKPDASKASSVEPASDFSTTRQ